MGFIRFCDNKETGVSVIKVREVMKKRVITADPDLSMADVAKIMTNNRVGSVVVMRDDKPVSIVTDDDLVTIIAQGKSPKKVRISDIPRKRRNLIVARPDETVTDVAKKMIKNGIKRVPVIERGKLLGMVSDKEILLVSPELIEILSEKLKMRVERVADPAMIISGICENCEAYSDRLANVGGRWLCEDCR
jgi:CBS domain-containing protein